MQQLSTWHSIPLLLPRSLGKTHSWSIFSNHGCRICSAHIALYDFFVETAAADASAVTNRTDGVIRIVVATRDGARLASVLRNHAIRALRAIDAAAAAARPRVNRRRSAVDEALIAAASPLKPSAARDGRVAIVQAAWRGARLRLAWRREESALILQGLWRGYARLLTRRE